MNTWQLAASTDEYQQAVKATAALTKDQRAVGFVAPHEFATQYADTNLQRQNNTLVHLLVQAIEEIKSLTEKVQIISDKLEALSKGKATEVQLPPDVVDKLSAQFTATHVSQGKFRGKGKDGQFRVWK